MTNKEIGIIVGIIIIVSALVYFGMPSETSDVPTETQTEATSTGGSGSSGGGTSSGGTQGGGSGAVVSPTGYAMGQTIQLLGVTLTTTSVIEDSRCPEGSGSFACVWEGTVRVAARLRKDTYTSANTDDIEGFTLGVPKKYGKHEITLTGVLPYPKIEERIRDNEYRFTWVVVPTE